MEKILKILIIIVSFFTYLNAEFAVKSYYEIRNKRVVRQSYEESCGASSIATLINLFDIKKYSESDVLNYLLDDNKTINTNMLSFKELKEILNKIGYESNGYQIDRNLFDKLNIPVLVKVENDPRYPHFVVAISHKGDFITILDPSFGEYISLKNDFFNLWDKQGNGGYALIVAPNIKNINVYHKLKLPNKILFEK